jgi:hypothetical protein
MNPQSKPVHKNVAEPRRVPNKHVQPTGWIGLILASRSGTKAFPIYQCGSFQRAADAQAVAQDTSNQERVVTRCDRAYAPGGSNRPCATV